MSARALIACSFAPAPAAKQTVAIGYPAPEGSAAELKFREDLWHEYRREALNAGFSAAHAIEYASALSPEMGQIAGASAMVPLRRDWFYQSRTWVVNRTVTSGLITLTRWEKSKATWRTEAASAALLARKFRWWNAEGKT